MKIVNKFSLTIDSQETNIDFVKSVVKAFLAKADATVEEVNDVGCAVSETLSNCIHHAYPNGVGKIYISTILHQDGYVKIKIRDKGCGIKNITHAMKPLYTSKPGQRHSGLGFSVMESFCDKVSVDSTPSKGTTITLYKKISMRVKE